MQLTHKRPKGLVPGTMDWLREVEGPRLLEKLVRVVHGDDEFTPTQARVAGMLMDRVAPTVSAVHHTVESTYGKMTTDQLKAELKHLLAGDPIDIEAIEVEYKDE